MSKELRTGPGNREQRFLSIGSAGIAVRAEGDATPVINGYGALFNQETVIAGFFRERILPGAFKDSIAQDDIRVAFNHSPNYILGRTSAKTATVTEDETGLRYEAKPPKSRADVVESIQRRDITGSSFQFEVENPDDEEWDYSQRKEGKLPLRTIKRAKLWETGPVAWPAYDNTTVSARAVACVEEARATLAAAEQQAQAAAEPQTPTEARAEDKTREAAADTRDSHVSHLEDELNGIASDPICG